MLTLPNLITCCRIALTPFIILAILHTACSQALTLCAAAGLSDALDGILARQFGWKSRLGAYLDPVADKLLLVSVYLSLGFAQIIPAWLVWIVVLRDLLILSMVGYAMAFTKFREFPPSPAGKTSTAFQILMALAALAACTFNPPDKQLYLQVLTIATATITVWSGIDYAVRGIRMLSQERKSVEPAGRPLP